MRITTREEVLEFIRSRRIHVDGRHMYQCEGNAPRYTVNRDSVLYALFLHDWNYNVSNRAWIPVGPDVSEAHHGDSILTMAHDTSRKMDSLASDALDDVDALFMEALNALPDSAVWVARENLRFLFGIYEQPLFVQQLRKLNIRIQDDLWWHFVHVSKTDPKMVALTQEHTKGQRDIQTPMKVGRYLQQFYGKVLTEQQIRAMANGVKQLTLCWATTKHEMEDVYINGPSSCMAGRFSDLEPHHPVHVYDFEGQFKLAYLRDNATECIVARGLVHEPTKTWVRIYGDEANSLENLLDEEGYSHADSWYDAYVADISYEGNTIMPYIDGDDKYVRYTRFNGRGCYSINGDGVDAVYANRTDGYLSEPDSEGDTCDACGERGNDTLDDMYYSDYHEIYIGRCCIDNYHYAYTGSRDQTYVHSDECVYCESNGEYYLESYAEEVLTCVSNGDWYYSEDTTETFDGDTIHVDDVLVVDDTTLNMDNSSHAKLVIVCTDASTLKPDEEPVRLIEHFDDTGEPYITDDYGRKWLTNWTTLVRMLDIADSVAPRLPDDDEHERASYLAQVVEQFNRLTGFSLNTYWTARNYIQKYL